MALGSALASPAAPAPAASEPTASGDRSSSPGLSGIEPRTKPFFAINTPPARTSTAITTMITTSMPWAYPAGRFGNHTPQPSGCCCVLTHVNRTAKAAIVILAAGAIAPVAAQAHHQPGHTGGGGGGGNLTLAAAPNPVVSGRTLTLSGKLTGQNNAGQVINLFADPFPVDTFVAAGNPTTNTAGDYQLTLRPRINTRYQAKRGNEQSAIVTVLVRPAVSLRLSDYTPKRAQVVRFYGRVCPQHNGAIAAIQRRYSTGYRTVRRTRLKAITGSSCSSYSRSFRVYRDGRYRTVISGHPDHATGVSSSRVANAHN